MQPDREDHDVVAVDVGGANLKAADGRGWAHAEPFPLWQAWQSLPQALARIVVPRRPRRLVATMTGEIADCYPSRAAGIAHIAAAVAEASAVAGCVEEPGFYLVDGRIVPRSVVEGRPLAAAASNWHAVARLAGAIAPVDRCLLIDVGSTTTDLVPIADAVPVPIGRDDAARMATGELVYTGMERTPLPAIVRRLPHGGMMRSVASERFAESRDAWILLGGLPEEPARSDTADGGPATRAAARIRLARSVLVEPSDFTADDAERAAAWCAEAQARQIARAARRVSRLRGWTPAAAIVSGHGGRLADMAIAMLGWDVRNVTLADACGAAASRVAPAHALALIARGDLA